jgi:hypothetical protein
MSPFVPFSDTSKLWEPRAEELRRMVPPPPRENMSFDPWLLAPNVGLRVIPCTFAGLTDTEKHYMQGLSGDHWSGGLSRQFSLMEHGYVCSTPITPIADKRSPLWKRSPIHFGT